MPRWIKKKVTVCDWTVEPSADDSGKLTGKKREKRESAPKRTTGKPPRKKKLKAFTHSRRGKKTALGEGDRDHKTAKHTQRSNQ